MKSSEDILAVIRRFAEPLTNDNNHRYKSWEHCYKAYSMPEKSEDELCLNLAFYLASWGMYRGSSGLLWKDYKVHKPVLEVLKNHQHLKNEIITENNFGSVIKLCTDIKDVYRCIDYNNGKNKGLKYISPTDTLVSKIILGTLGCLPAFDRYFNKGCFNYQNVDITHSSLINLSKKTYELMPELFDCQKYLKMNLGFEYPIMKIVDMYYWQLGFEIDKNTSLIK
jgi:hypothetical protein